MGDAQRSNIAVAEGVRKPRAGGYWWYDYGTPLRDAAMSYALLTRYQIPVDGRENLLSIVAGELERSRYHSTQEKIALFLVGRTLSAAGGTWSATITGGSRPEPVNSNQPYFREVSTTELSSGLRLTNNSKANLYLEVSLTGNPILQPPSRSDVIQLDRALYTPEGRAIGGRALEVGEVVLVHITATSKTDIGAGLIVDRIPAGLEIENSNIAQGEQLGTVMIANLDPGQAMRDPHIKHIEFRDDRFVAAVRFDSSPFYYGRNADPRAIHLFYRARVVTPGDFIVPPLYAEDMYRPNTFGLTGGNDRITVVDARAR
jgi:uncharacterized protein YfaS (alpha-2-macroglobulin family)